MLRSLVGSEMCIRDSNIPGNSVRTGTHQTDEWSPSGYDRFGGEGGSEAFIWDYDSRMPEGHPKPKLTGAMRGGRGAGHGDSPSGKDRTAGWGTPRQGSLPGELRVLARHLQIGCRGTGTRGNHPRIRCRQLTQQENDRVALCNTHTHTHTEICVQVSAQVAEGMSKYILACLLYTSPSPRDS